MPTPTRSFEVIERLVAAGIDFTVVGMTAGVLHGAPAVTFDLDVLYARSPENIRKLLVVLSELGAVFRTDSRGIAPNESHLQSAGHKLLMTDFGVVDLLGSLDGRDYEEVFADTVGMTVSEMEVRVLSLEALIAAKERAGRDKDLAVLPLLRATLARKQEKQGDA
jgi:hypothetical protein